MLDVEFFIAIKAIELPAAVKARSIIGDDFSTTGLFSGAVINIDESDIVHGNFDKIYVTQSDLVVAYIGR